LFVATNITVTIIFVYTGMPKDNYHIRNLVFHIGLQPKEGEEFRRVEDFPDYFVSNLGRVISCRTSIPKLMVQRKHLGYCSVQLSYHGASSLARRPLQWMVHRLVMFTFVGPPSEGLTDCCHNDGNGLNNHLDNLRWDSSKRNQHEKLKHGVGSFDNRKGCKNSEEHRRRISESQKKRWAEKKKIT